MLNLQPPGKPSYLHREKIIYVFYYKVLKISYIRDIFFKACDS